MIHLEPDTRLTGALGRKPFHTTRLGHSRVPDAALAVSSMGQAQRPTRASNSQKQAVLEGISLPDGNASAIIRGLLRARHPAYSPYSVGDM
jgi:hypothetical protein